MTQHQAGDLEINLKSRLQLELIEIKYWKETTRDLHEEHLLALSIRKVEEIRRQIKIIEEIDWENAEVVSS